MAGINRKGLRDWFIQRVSAVIIGIYTLIICAYFLINHPPYSLGWYHLNQHLGMKVFTLMVLISILAHAWIGLWTVFTDYIKNIPLRIILEIIVFTLLIAYVVWGVEILWG